MQPKARLQKSANVNFWDLSLEVNKFGGANQRFRNSNAESGNSQDEAGEYPRNIDFGNSPNISEDGRIILVFQSITGHCQILTDGFAEGYGCASGRCGANRKPKSRIY